MILRILGQGQLRVDDAHAAELNRLDDAVATAVGTDDDAAFRQALAALLDRVTALGQPLADDDLLPSDAVLPPADAHVDEVRALLDASDEGLVPG